jgi:hypothetical protein
MPPMAGRPAAKCTSRDPDTLQSYINLVCSRGREWRKWLVMIACARFALSATSSLGIREALPVAPSAPQSARASPSCLSGRPGGLRHGGLRHVESHPSVDWAGLESCSRCAVSLTLRGRDASALEVR